MHADATQRPTAAELAEWAPQEAHSNDGSASAAQPSTAQQNWNRLQQIPRAQPPGAARGNDGSAGGAGLALEGIFKGRATSSTGGGKDAARRKGVDLKLAKKAPSKQATLSMTRIFS